MPAVKKINKEDILGVCIDIIKTEGIQNLNARKIASKLNCSTQPIFYIYSNMDDLKQDVLKEISSIFDRCMLKGNTCNLSYKDLGINYINFASTEPILFKILFSIETKSEALKYINSSGASEKIFETISKETGLTIDKAKKFHLKMFLYVCGIANLIANKACSFTSEEINKLLREQYISMILFEIHNGNIDEDILNNILKK